MSERMVEAINQISAGPETYVDNEQVVRCDNGRIVNTAAQYGSEESGYEPSRKNPTCKASSGEHRPTTREGPVNSPQQYPTA